MYVRCVVYLGSTLCQSYLMQGQGHLEGPNSVHVCRNDGDSTVASLGVSEGETPQKIHLETWTFTTTKKNTDIQKGGEVYNSKTRLVKAMYLPRFLTWVCSSSDGGEHPWSPTWCRSQYEAFWRIGSRGKRKRWFTTPELANLDYQNKQKWGDVCCIY